MPGRTGSYKINAAGMNASATPLPAESGTKDASEKNQQAAGVNGANKNAENGHAPVSANGGGHVPLAKSPALHASRRIHASAPLCDFKMFSLRRSRLLMLQGVPSAVSLQEKKPGQRKEAASAASWLLFTRKFFYDRRASLRVVREAAWRSD